MQNDNQPSPQQQPTGPPPVNPSDTAQPLHRPAVPKSVYPDPVQAADVLPQTGISASELGLNQSPDKKSFNKKKFIIKGALGLVLVGGVVAALVLTNVIALTRLKTIDYTSSEGTHYKLKFYAKHTEQTNNSGKKAFKELVSKVAVDGHYPIKLSIYTGDLSSLDKNGIKNCNGKLPKAFDVQNNNVNQNIPVCTLPVTNGVEGAVYVGGFAYYNKAHIVTIGQDLSGVNLSDASGAQTALTKFGLTPFQDDIKKIVASIEVE